MSGPSMLEIGGQEDCAGRALGAGRDLGLQLHHVDHLHFDEDLVFVAVPVDQ